MDIITGPTTESCEDSMILKGGKNMQKNYTKKIFMTQISTMV